jgi:hypothetical protein
LKSSSVSVGRCTDFHPVGHFQLSWSFVTNRWKSGVCAACFGEQAEKGGIAYSFQDIEVKSWSERGRRRGGGHPGDDTTPGVPRRMDHLRERDDAALIFRRLRCGR